MQIIWAACLARDMQSVSGLALSCLRGVDAQLHLDSDHGPKVNNQSCLTRQPNGVWLVQACRVWRGLMKRQFQPPTNCSSLSADKCSIEWIRCPVARHQMRSQLKPPQISAVKQLAL